LATVRAERVAVIGGVEDISVIELTCFLELLDQQLDELVDRLQRSKTTAEKVVEVGFLRRVLRSVSE
jgi:predicted transcriptional regulator